MTRLRNKNAKNQPQKDEEGVKRPKTGLGIAPPKPKQPDFIDSFLINNWKQQALVKKGDSSAALTSLILMLQVLATVGFGTFAGISGGSPQYLVPAIATAGYTVASINNAFDKNLHGLVAFLDSPFMISAIMAVLVNSFIGGPSSIMTWLMFLLCCLPFLADWMFSMRSAFVQLTGEPNLAQTCTVTELTPENEENFLSADSGISQQATQSMYNPSDRIVPDVIAQIEPINNLMTGNWKENAVATTNSTTKQLAAFALIAGYFYLGGVGVESGSYTTIGAISLAYASSSLFGYFGLADAPITKLMRVNGVSAVCAVMGLMTMATGGMDMALAMMTIMHMFDAYQGAINTERDNSIGANLDNEYERQGLNQERANSDGPVVNFFTESWRLNSFNKKNFETCQIVQIVLFGAQLYAALIAGINGGSPVLISMIIAMILAGAYSFFSPMRITAVDALQSNGAQVAVLGASLHHVVTATPGIPFYILFCLLSAELMMSCSTFFQDHQQSVGQQVGHTMGLLEKDNQDYQAPNNNRRGGGGPNDDSEYSRQL